jgi:hypothetical protein
MKFLLQEVLNFVSSTTCMMMHYFGRDIWSRLSLAAHQQDKIAEDVASYSMEAS